jgi:hypothetical protein
MKKFIILSILFLISSFVFAQDVYVSGYYRSNGTYVKPHYRTAPNHTINDNYSTYPNVNPYTGKVGTIAPDYSSLTPNLTPSLSTNLTYNLNSNLTYNLSDNLSNVSLDKIMEINQKDMENFFLSKYKIDITAYKAQQKKEEEEFRKLFESMSSSNYKPNSYDELIFKILNN